MSPASFSAQMGVTGTKFIFLPETVKKCANHLKQGFLRHDTLSNKGHL